MTFAAGGPGAILTNGSVIPYRQEGAGEPVVLVHGMLTDHGMWDRVVDIVSQQHEVIAPTLSFFGATLWRNKEDRFSADTHADELAGLISTLCDRPVKLVGWSMGGSICLLLAARKPHLIDEMLLYEPSLFAALTDQKQIEAAVEDRTAMFAKARATFASGDATRATEYFVDGANGVTGMFSSFPNEVQHVFQRNSRTMGPFFDDPPPPNITPPDIRRIDVPTTLMLGEQSRRTWQLILPALTELLPDAQLRRVLDATHLWPIKNPDAFAREVLEKFGG